MLRILMAAMAFQLVSAQLASAASAGAGPADSREQRVTVQLRLAARLGGSQVSAPAVAHARMPSRVMDRTINGITLAGPATAGEGGMLALLVVGGDERELALPVSDSVSLGLGYEYLRREDLQLEVAETASMREEYSSHNVMLRAHWRF